MKEVIVLIVKYLRHELESSSLTPDAAEGVEVAVQCIESAYNITQEDIESSAITLQELFSQYRSSQLTARIVSDEQKEEAENLKLVGNNLMKEGKFGDAIVQYTRAIELDNHNAVYFCNRAAAHIKLANYDAAISDCKEAIKIDGTYSKAYSRLGFAYGATGNQLKSRDSYRKAMELEPENESYRTSYQNIEEQLAGPSASQPYSDMTVPFPGIDLSALLKNPGFMQMATQMLADPGMQNAVSRILTGQTFPLGSVEDLINAGQQLADRLQQDNGDTRRGEAPAGASNVRQENLVPEVGPAAQHERVPQEVPEAQQENILHLNLNARQPGLNPVAGPAAPDLPPAEFPVIDPANRNIQALDLAPPFLARVPPEDHHPDDILEVPFEDVINVGGDARPPGIQQDEEEFIQFDGDMGEGGGDADRLRPM